MVLHAFQWNSRTLFTEQPTPRKLADSMQHHYARHTTDRKCSCANTGPDPFYSNNSPISWCSPIDGLIMSVRMQALSTGILDGTE